MSHNSVMPDSRGHDAEGNGNAMKPSRLIIGMSGASGAAYGIRLLEVLKESTVETHLVMSKAAAMTIAYETDRTAEEVRALADVSYPVADVGAAIASGSYKTTGMVIAPCSIKTLSEVATCNTGNLLSRAADVVLKERRRLVLLVRETPLHTGHLRMMTQASESGAVIMPPVPAFYSKPETLDDMIDHTVGRVLDLFDIDNDLVKRWREGA
jgi:4-hydroxy-3-polyprenylbenzoate decarboxylase